MESKPKACCANCEWCDKNGYKCKRNGAFVEKWMFCTYYHGNGITPEQEILELKNKLAAQCAVYAQQTGHKEAYVSQNGDSVDIKPQFTVEEMKYIKASIRPWDEKEATLADSIIAKCEAMLKGAQK